ncbi:MAG: nucleotidyltransferase domain-containing protein [Candidatus Sumerlaeaceae bacterium]|jgi:hypothetical protein
MDYSTPSEQAERLPQATATEAQGVLVEVLFALLDRMEQGGVRVWVHGGWAIDALTGTSRSHKDIDLLADEKDRPWVREQFGHALIKETSHKLEFLFRGASVEVTFFRRLWNGVLATVTPRIIVRWEPHVLGETRALLHGRSIPVVGIGALYAEIANRVNKKSEMLEKNARDLQRLKPLLTDTICRESGKYFPVPNTFWNRAKLFLGF